MFSVIASKYMFKVDLFHVPCCDICIGFFEGNEIHYFGIFTKIHIRLWIAFCGRLISMFIHVYLRFSCSQISETVFVVAIKVCIQLYESYIYITGIILKQLISFVHIVFNYICPNRICVSK